MRLPVLALGLIAIGQREQLRHEVGNLLGWQCDRLLSGLDFSLNALLNGLNRILVCTALCGLLPLARA